MRRRSSFLTCYVFAGALATLRASEPSGVAGEFSESVWYSPVEDHYLESLFTDPNFYGPATFTNNVPELSSPINILDDGLGYGRRYRGYLVAPVTGEYRFWITGDDDQGLWLGTSESKFTKQEIARSRNWTIPEAFGKHREQAATPVNLVAGQRYYLEALQKDGAEGSHLGVSWSYAEGAGLTNWALEPGVTASQSSTDLGGVAERAIDGNTSGVVQDGSVSITKSEAWSEWQVDLGQSRLIDRIEIFNRDKDGAHVRAQLQNYKITIFDSSQNTVANKSFHPVGNNTHTQAVEFWETGGKTGRIVKITQLGGSARYLNLAEVRVLGRSSAADAYLPQEILSGSNIQSYAGSNLDVDGDELLDSWETTHGFDPTILQSGDRSPAADPDGDGLYNALESLEGTDPFLANSLAGAFTLEYWQGNFGTDVADFVRSSRYFEAPDRRAVVRPLDALRLDNLGRDLAYRMRGSFTAPTTGSYRFWISNKDGAEFWLSDDATKFRKRRLMAMGPRFGTAYGNKSDFGDRWDRFLSQMSDDVDLVAGQTYFFEILGQRNNVWDGDVAIAWAPPGQSRSLLPASVLESFSGDSLDLDDDYLPDAWEVSFGLDATDNGATNPETEGEYGDFDDDGLTNHEEYLLGTDPSSHDTDNDGLPDLLERDTYGTDPLVSDAPSETVSSTVDLSSYVSSAHPWLETTEGLVPTSFRGNVIFNFNAPTSGHWLLKVTSKLLGGSLTDKVVPVHVSINGTQLETRRLIFGAQDRAIMSLVTPNLTGGNHTLNLDFDNLIAQRSVMIEKIEVIAPGGLDANSNGIADWIDEMLGQVNSIVGVSQYSRVSPWFVEGVARAGVTINSETPNQGISSNHWYTSLELDSQTPTNVSVNYYDGVSESTAITWEATNVMDNETLVIRQGDSLLLGATPLSGATGQAVSLTVTGQTNHALDPSAVATQSSTPSANSPASNAIDGETYGPADNQSARTGQDPNAWWQVDLGQERSIERIVIWNKAPDKWALANFKVDVLDDLGNVTITKDFYTTGVFELHVREKEVWDLGGLYDARTVRIERLGPVEGQNLLELAEVQVFGSSDIQLATDSDVTEFQFDIPGVHALTATHPNGDVGSLTVEVKKGESDTPAFDLLSLKRDWITFDPATTDTDLFFDGGEFIRVEQTPQFGRNDYDEITRFRLPTYADQRGSYNVLLRAFEQGPVVAAQPVNVVGFTSGLSGGSVSAISSPHFKGMTLITVPLVVTDLPTGGYVQITSIRSGLIFLDGTPTLTLTAADFVDGVYDLQFLFPQHFTGGFCHSITIYDGDGKIMVRQ